MNKQILNKQDRRYQRTDDLIKNTFIELTQEKKSTAKITVKEICERANLNRGTFYLHYETVPQLIDCLEEEYAQELIEACSVYHYDQNTVDFFDGIFNAVKNNPELFYFYFFVSQGKGIQIFETYLQNYMLPQWLCHGTMDEMEATLVLKFLLKGTMELLKDWHLNHFRDEKQFKEIFDKIVMHGLYNLVYSKD